MNQIQKRVLIISIAAVVLMMTFPPYATFGPGWKESNGYAFILSGIRTSRGLQPSIDLAQLAFQIIVTCLVGLAISYLFKDKK
jgi:ABC-type Fe3+ transport system permease subunit